MDLDFFTTEKNFDVKKLLGDLSRCTEWRVTMEENNTLYGELFGAKVSFISYPFFIRRLPEQYPSVAHDYHHILKALVYFDDAESDPDPEINFDADWQTVKSFFQKEIPGIVNLLV